MLKIGLFLLILNFLVPAFAQFDGTSITVPNPQQNTVRTLKYVYRNKDTKPHIVIVTKYADSSSPCHLTKPSGAPVLPGKILELYVTCKFKNPGFHRRSVASLQISAEKKYDVSLMFTASVEENLSNRIIGDKNHTTCTEIDLNKGKILPKLPVLDQDGVGSCYAHTAALIYEFELKKANKNQTVSPIDVGLTYKRLGLFEKEDSLNSGIVLTALKRLNEFGAATRECIDKVIKEESKKSNLTSENYINLIQRIYKELDTLKETSTPSKELQSICTSYKISADELVRLTKMLDTTLIDYLKEEFTRCASERNKVKHALTGTFVDQTYGTKEKLKDTLDDLLKAGSLPAISFCAQIIQGKSAHIGVNSQNKPLAGDKCGKHAVAVSARKNINGQCHYLLRNSWGADWKRNDLTCACQSSAGYFQDCSKAPSSATNKKYVGCWVNESSLWNNTYSVQGIK